MPFHRLDGDHLGVRCGEQEEEEEEEEPPEWVRDEVVGNITVFKTPTVSVVAGRRVYWRRQRRRRERLRENRWNSLIPSSSSSSSVVVVVVVLRLPSDIFITPPQIRTVLRPPSLFSVDQIEWASGV